MTNKPDALESQDERKEVPSQSELFEDLRSICELEDQKQAIQNEIQARTQRLRASLAQLEKDTLLYQMLASTFGQLPADSPATVRRAGKGRARK